MSSGNTNNHKIIYCKEIGEIKLIKNPRARRLSIKVKPFDGVIVSIPTRGSYKEAEEFVKHKTEWIIQSLRKIEKFEDKLTVFDEKTPFQTKKHHLIIEKWDKEYISVRVLNWKIMVKYPENVIVRDEQIQQMIRKGIERALLIEASEFLPLHVKNIAAKLGFKYKSLTIKNGKSRWGSCSHDNRINLNLHLMRLPNELIDYVIIHELCHTIQKNHGPKFWGLMEQVFPKSIVLNKELKKYQTKVY
jgi:predicted metal-dependent hydrolase